MTDGWIKLHRKLIEKAIWQESTPEQKTILITLLMMANHQEKEWEWKGEKYKAEPGQFVTSLPSIVRSCGKGITIQNVRTALARFKNYDFLTDQPTNKNRLITIVNWDIYQTEDDKPNRQTNRQLTGNQQATNRQLTANKNDKNDKNDKNIYMVLDHYKKTFEGYYKKITLTKKRESHINARLNEGYTVEQINQAISNIRTSSYHTGENDKGMFYATLEFICRSPENLEKWINHIPKKVADKKPEGKGFDNFKKREYDPEELKQKLLKKSRGE